MLFSCAVCCERERSAHTVLIGCDDVAFRVDRQLSFMRPEWIDSYQARQKVATSLGLLKSIFHIGICQSLILPESIFLIYVNHWQGTKGVQWNNLCYNKIMSLSLDSLSFMCWLYLTTAFQHSALCVSLLFCCKWWGDLCYQPIIPLSFTCHLALGLTGECVPKPFNIR